MHTLPWPRDGFPEMKVGALPCGLRFMSVDLGTHLTLTHWLYVPLRGWLLVGKKHGGSIRLMAPLESCLEVGWLD